MENGREQLHALMDEYAIIQHKLNDPMLVQLQERSKEIKGEIKELVVREEETVAHNGVTAEFKAGYDRVTWNSKRMDNLLIERPDLSDLLKPARKVTSVSPTIRLSVEGM